MMKKPKILITNDDGINAEGILQLWKALKEAFDLAICAPSTEQSGKALSITLMDNLHVHKVDWHTATPAWSVSGTPADCVKMAVSALLESPPDLIVSGINRGTNHGRSLLYSGTVGGVIEGIFRGIPGIAFSAFDFDNIHYPGFVHYIPKIVQYVLEQPLPTGSLLNVNFPSVEKKAVSGVKLARQGRQYWISKPQPCQHHVNSYVLDSYLTDHDEHELSDSVWLEKGFITCVPVHVNELTDFHYLQSKQSEFERIMNS
jgi:5'-nucleotidase